MLVFVLFVAGFVILTFGANWLVDGASSIAKRFNIPNLIIGLTIVAFGTSAPEMVVNLLASYNGNTEIAIGNVVGSNIFNILVILGISSIIYPLKVHQQTIFKEIPLSLLAAIVLFACANDQIIDGQAFNTISRIDGLIFLSFFIIFIYYTIDISTNKANDASDEDVKQLGLGKSILYIIAGLAGLIIGGRWIVNGAVEIAAIIGISESITGLTIIAAGTSLPELATSVVAAYKRNADIAIGNVVGSNIFNIFFILGLSSLISPLPLAKSNNIDILMVILASLLLVLFVFIGKGRQITKGEGILLLVVYLSYLIYLVLPYV